MQSNGETLSSKSWNEILRAAPKATSLFILIDYVLSTPTAHLQPCQTRKNSTHYSVQGFVANQVLIMLEYQKAEMSLVCSPSCPSMVHFSPLPPMVSLETYTSLSWIDIHLVDRWSFEQPEIQGQLSG